jgi:hypothetical protein
VPDIKPHYKHQSHMNTTFNTQLFSLRNQQQSPQTTLPVPVFSNLQQLKQQIVQNQQRGSQKKRPQPTAYSTKSNGFGFVPLEATVKTHQPQVRQQLHDVLMGDINQFSHARNSLTKPPSDHEPLQIEVQPRRGISIGTAQTTQAFNQTSNGFALSNIKANSYHQARTRVDTVNSSITGHSDHNYANPQQMAT